MPIHTDLRHMLARRRMKLGELARKAGVTASNLSRLGNGHARAVRFSTLDALCRILRCQPGELISYMPPEIHRKLYPRGKRLSRRSLSHRYERFCLLAVMAFGALDEGKHAEAKRLACELLDSAEDYKDDWNYGNALHAGNIVLGRLALLSGRLGEAKARLLDAGRSPGSPQLMSFGPNFSLAHQLLKRGGRNCVLEFMELCAQFWSHGGERLARWRHEVRAGRIPDFGCNLRYLA